MKLVKGADLRLFKASTAWDEVVYFDGNFCKRKRHLFTEMETKYIKKDQKGFNFRFYHCNIDDDEIAMDFVVDELGVKELPVVVTFLRQESRELRYQSIVCGNIPVIHSNLMRNEAGAPSKIIEILAETSGTKLFISGDRSQVGKSTTCLGLLARLVRLGMPSSKLAYIKPVTQCEAEQPVSRYCKATGIEHAPGPVVFYKGFTRAFLNGQTPSSEELLNQSAAAVEHVARNKAFTLIDGVGYPAVGSICGISNAHNAARLGVPVLLVGKSGVGDAVDSHNINASYFLFHGVPVIGAIFNKLDTEGFYSRENCEKAVSQYFKDYNKDQDAYGFMPKAAFIEGEAEDTYIDKAEQLFDFIAVNRLLIDAHHHSLPDAPQYHRGSKRSRTSAYAPPSSVLSQPMVIAPAEIPQTSMASSLDRLSRATQPSKRVRTATSSVSNGRDIGLSRAEIEAAAEAKGAKGG